MSGCVAEVVYGEAPAAEGGHNGLFANPPGTITVIHHIDFVVTDFERSRAFYAAALAPLEMAPVVDRKHDDGRRVTGFGQLPDPLFYVRNSWLYDGRALPGRLHVAFSAPSRAAVDAFHAAALAAGGTDYGKPGLRPHYAEHYYSAYVLDPDGHNVEAVCRREA